MVRPRRHRHTSDVPTCDDFRRSSPRARSERTVRADLAFLRERCAAPLRHDRGRGGYYYTDPAFSLPMALVSEGELVAFFLSIELARRYLGTSFEQPLRKAVEKLASGLPSELQIDLSQLTQHYTFQAGATLGSDPGLLAKLFEAMRERWPVQITYLTASSGERKQREIDPYHLFNVRGDWQVIAFDHLRGQFRQFAVSRIEQWQVLDDTRFTRDTGFSPEGYLSTGFLAERGDQAEQIVVWFDAYQARYIRGREFHPSQRVEDHPDESMTLRFQSGALAEIRRWVMDFGSHARLLEPAALAAEIATELRATLKIYENS